MADEPNDNELSDEEALALLNEIESDSLSDPEEQNETLDGDKEEEEKLLAEMEASPEDSSDMDDDEAKRLLAEMEAPPEDRSDMDDDEAKRLLAEMEAPPEDRNEIDDDEAKRLLAEMEAPPEDSEEKNDPEQTEDDAEKLLAQLEGDADGNSDPANSPPASEANSDDETDSVDEIDEWEANDFQSDPTMMEDFITNADELMETLDDAILRLEQNPSDQEIIEEIFRAAHTLKGASGMFGFRGLERVMHRMENLFDNVRKGKLVPNSDTIDVVFQGIDIIKTLLDAVKNGSPCGVKTAPIVGSLQLAAKGKPTSQNKPQTPEPTQSFTTTSSNGSDQPPNSGDGGAGGSAQPNKGKKESSTIRVDLQRLDALVNLVGELVIDRTRFMAVEEELRTTHPQLKATGNLAETVQLYGRHMNEIQNIIMKVRMVPIGNAFNKYPRIVRDLARSLNKKIDLTIIGEQAELDKTLVEQIGDPLVHLIRNACDHGVETPDIRQQNGKPPSGNITLAAHQEGNQIVITIEDDGKGMDSDIIRKKGIEKGLISEEDNLSNREIFNLIFEPGFSTAEKVTNVSGRGVGMDVVKKQITKLKGTIEIDSELGRGSRIEIRLPLTLAIVQSLLVKVQEEIYAIPLDAVIESIRTTPSEIQKVGDSEVIRLRNKVLPLMYLNEVLNLDQKSGSLSEKLRQMHTDHRQSNRKKERIFIVVVGSGERRFGLVVDELLNQQEMVIKSMGPLLKNIRCVAGGAVLGQGEVVLVLDIADLEDSFRLKNRSNPQQAA